MVDKPKMEVKKSAAPVKKPAPSKPAPAKPAPGKPSKGSSCC
jgi:hypothetical protein